MRMALRLYWPFRGLDNFNLHTTGGFYDVIMPYTIQINDAIL